MTDLARYYDESIPPDLLVPPVAPVLTTLTPSSIVVNTPTTVLIDGTDFTGASQVWVDGVRQSTTHVSATRVSYLGQADQVGTQDVRVVTQGLPSNALVLTITASQQEEPVPSSSWVKAEIVSWLLVHGTSFTEEALTDLTKAELLVLVEELLNEDHD